MANFNQCSFIGHLGKDPELTVTPDGKPVTKFSLAVDQGGKNKDGSRKQDTMWLNITTWDKLAEITEKYAHKGTHVFVQGKLVIRAYEDKQGVKRQAIDIVATVVQILDKKQNDGRPPTAVDTDDDAWIPSE